MSKQSPEVTDTPQQETTSNTTGRPVVVTSAVSAFFGAMLAVLALGGSSEKIVVKELVLQDRVGETRAQMRVDDTGTVGLVMFDAEGKAHIEIGCTTEGVAMVGLVKPDDDQPRLILRASADSHGLLTLNPDGSPNILLGDAGNGPVVRLQGGGAGQSVILGASPQGWVDR